MQSDDFRQRFLRLDEDADIIFGDEDCFIYIIVSGSAFVLLGYSTRATHDIDMRKTSPKLSELLIKYDGEISP